MCQNFAKSTFVRVKRALDAGPNWFTRKILGRIDFCTFFVRSKSYFDLNLLSGTPTNKAVKYATYCHAP